MESDNEAKLRAFKAGDPRTWFEIDKATRGSIVGWLKKHGASEPVALDCYQQAQLRLYVERGVVDTWPGVFGFLRHLAWWCFQNHLRSGWQRKVALVSTVGEPEPFANDAPATPHQVGPDQRVEDAELARAILAELSAKERDAIFLDAPEFCVAYLCDRQIHYNWRKRAVVKAREILKEKHGGDQ